MLVCMSVCVSMSMCLCVFTACFHIITYSYIFNEALALISFLKFYNLLRYRQLGHSWPGCYTQHFPLISDHKDSCRKMP